MLNATEKQIEMIKDMYRVLDNEFDFGTIFLDDDDKQEKKQVKFFKTLFINFNFHYDYSF